MKARRSIRVIICMFIIISMLLSIGMIDAFADDEYTIIPTGLLADSNNTIDTSQISYGYGSGILPDSIDLTDSTSFPKVRDQGPMGSCASWATTYYQYGFQVADMNNWYAKTRATQQFSPKFVYNIVNNGVNEGSNFEDNYRVLQSQGAVRYYLFPPSLNSTNPSEYLAWYTN